MAAIKFAGPIGFRVTSFAALNKIAISTYLRHSIGRKLHPDWDANLEIGVRFWRRQFTLALQQKDMARGRQILDSVQTDTPDEYLVSSTNTANPNGTWYRPHTRKSDATILYLHGGGDTFHGAMSKRFAAMLAHHIAAPVFAPDYRLTPEHPHPAQAEDALTAWHYVRSNVTANNIVVIGDSAGGHMMLMLLLELQKQGEQQPALGIGLCPWTDIGARGDSLHANNPTDLVQGWMALQFGKWLDPKGRFGRDALSPISHDFKNLAPLYLQAGGCEMLRDMIIDFANMQSDLGADILFDLWPNMPHDFQLMDSTQVDALEALARITSAVHRHVDQQKNLSKSQRTQVASGCFSTAV